MSEPMLPAARRPTSVAPRRARAAMLAAVLVGSTSAPFQCASEPDPNRTREETPGQALKGLADEFGKAGDREAKVRTLQYLVERYPRSKYAEEAKVELQELGIAIPAAASAGASASSPAAPSASAAPTGSAASGW
ncbi:MAG: hypothetical protein IPG04_19295 [Polyangiaceae bacterium]|nr:hypothetical protein [Polyangiaceae bacterium]